MGPIKIKRTIHLEAPAAGTTAQVRAIGYVSGNGDVLMESLSLGNRDVVRRSEDNGKSWAVVEEWTSRIPLDPRFTFHRNLPCAYFHDPDCGKELRFSVTHITSRDVATSDAARSPHLRTLRMHVQVSRDDGLTWSEPEQLIMSGADYNEIHWMPGVYFGRNYLWCADGMPPVKAADGRLVVPFQMITLFAGGDIVDPDADPAASNPDGATVKRAGCLRGRWRSNGGGMEWTAGETVVLPKKYSCCGAEEPSVAYMPDGRLFMGIRARVFPHTGQELPPLHYYALSRDDGATWSAPEPLLYDDGSYAYSPACVINVFRSTKNGRVYVITNLSDTPGWNCDPRNRLYICELDTERFRLKKNTLTLIAQNNKEAGQPDTTRVSNFRWYEDRETRDIVLHVTPRVPGAPDTQGGGSATSSVPAAHAWRCDIRLPT